MLGQLYYSPDDIDFRHTDIWAVGVTLVERYFQDPKQTFYQNLWLTIPEQLYQFYIQYAHQHGRLPSGVGNFSYHIENGDYVYLFQSQGQSTTVSHEGTLFNGVTSFLERMTPQIQTAIKSIHGQLALLKTHSKTNLFANRNEKLHQHLTYLQLMQDCLRENPLDRPTIDTVIERLDTIHSIAITIKDLPQYVLTPIQHLDPNVAGDTSTSSTGLSSSSSEDSDSDAGPD